MDVDTHENRDPSYINTRRNKHSRDCAQIGIEYTVHTHSLSLKWQYSTNDPFIMQWTNFVNHTSRSFTEQRNSNQIEETRSVKTETKERERKKQRKRPHLTEIYYRWESIENWIFDVIFGVRRVYIIERFSSSASSPSTSLGCNVMKPNLQYHRHNNSTLVNRITKSINRLQFHYLVFHNSNVLVYEFCAIFNLIA